MADDNQDQPTQDDEQARLALEEYQRQQAAAAVQASQGQPNAIPNEPAANRAVDYAQQPLSQGQVISGPAGGPSTYSMNRPTDQWGTPATPIGQSDYTQRGLPTVNEQTLNQLNRPDVPGINGVPAQFSPQEVAFWQANPLGAVPHPVTGELIGLGGNVASRQAALESITPPEQIAGSRLQQPDFVNVPQVDAALIDRRNQIANEIANTQAQMRGASTQRIGRGQPSQFETLNAKLATLQHADTALANEHFRQSQQSAHAADQNRKMQEEYNINRDATAAQIAMGRITAQPGTQEYKQAIANIALSYPHAVKDPRVEEALIKASTFHDERAAIAQKAAEAGLVEKVVGYGQKGPTIQYVKPVPDAPTTVQSRYDKLQAGIQGHLEQSAVEAQTKTLPNQPYSKAATLHAQQTEAALLEQRYPALKTSIPAATPPPANEQPKGYEVGARYGDLIYNGGDPKQRASWKPVQ